MSKSPVTLTLADLGELLDPDIYAAAFELVSRGLVGRVEWSLNGGDTQAFAIVGSEPHDVAAAIIFEFAAGQTFLRMVCSQHGGGPGCAHTAAVAIAIATGGELPRRRPADHTEPWRRALDRALGSGPERAPAATEPAAILFDYRKSEEWGSSRLALCVRPAVRGVRGSWIRDQLEWSSLDRRSLMPAQRRALAEFTAWYESRDAFEAVDDPDAGGYRYHGYYGVGAPRWLPLDELPARCVWPLLRQAQHAGIEFVSADRAQSPVHLASGVLAPTFDLSIARGRLRVTPRLVLSADSDAALEPLEAASETEASETGASETGRARGERGESVVGATSDAPIIAAIGTPNIGLATIARGDGKTTAITLHEFREPVDPAFSALQRGPVISVPSAVRDRFEREYLGRLREMAPVVSLDGSYDVPPPPISLKAGGFGLNLTDADYCILLDRGGTLRPRRRRSTARTVSGRRGRSWCTGSFRRTRSRRRWSRSRSRNAPCSTPCSATPRASRPAPSLPLTSGNSSPERWLEHEPAWAVSPRMDCAVRCPTRADRR